jgi:hypothetical protein
VDQEINQEQAEQQIADLVVEGLERLILARRPAAPAGQELSSLDTYTNKFH